MDRKASKNEKLISEGNAFYEIDLDCMERKRREQKEMERKKAGRYPGETKRFYKGARNN
ncbi:MAG: hypothetical protein Q4E89_00105 [Eubacteriales bacterium]|nr:hypothetical protein [Eubacteriales bacterium]